MPESVCPHCGGSGWKIVERDDASGAERCKVAIQTNNLDVDDRGYIYAVDRANTGMHILEFKRAFRHCIATRRSIISSCPPTIPRPIAAWRMSCLR